MERTNQFIKATASRDLWYNFDTKEIVTDTELRRRVKTHKLRIENVSNRIDIPIFGNIDWTIRHWIPFAERLVNPRKMQKPHGKIRVREHSKGLHYPNTTGAPDNFKAPGWTIIPAHSRGAKPWKELSPFFIGPVIFDEDVPGVGTVQKRAENFESFWQSFKAWKTVDRQATKDWKWPAEKHVDEEENPNANWYKWHDALLKNKSAVRRPNGRAVPLYAWWKGRKLGLIDSRRNIYIPFLQDLYRKSPTYQKLLEIVRNGTNIIILEPDGPRAELYPTGMDVNVELLLDLVSVQKMKDFPGGQNYREKEKYVAYGHGYVLALTLLEDLQ